MRVKCGVYLKGLELLNWMNSWDRNSAMNEIYQSVLSTPEIANGVSNSNAPYKLSSLFQISFQFPSQLELIRFNVNSCRPVLNNKPVGLYQSPQPWILSCSPHHNLLSCPSWVHKNMLTVSYFPLNQAYGWIWQQTISLLQLQPSLGFQHSITPPIQMTRTSYSS